MLAQRLGWKGIFQLLCLVVSRFLQDKSAINLLAAAGVAHLAEAGFPDPFLLQVGSHGRYSESG